jgi:hypothetical protein
LTGWAFWKGFVVEFGLRRLCELSNFEFDRKSPPSGAPRLVAMILGLSCRANDPLSQEVELQMHWPKKFLFHHQAFSNG